MATKRYARGLIVALAVMLVSGAATAFAQNENPGPGKNNTIPDFSSGRKMWVLASRGFEKIPGDTGPAPIAATGKFRTQTSDPIADTDNPVLQPWAKKVMDEANRKVLAGGTAFSAASRCFPGGVPGILFFPGEPIEILQTPKEVWLLWKRDAQIRRVYLDVPHSKNPAYSWYGESVGHYENGDTLVVDTIGLDDKGPIDRIRTPHTRQLHVVERYRLTKGGNVIEVTLHIEDPGTFTAPWNARVQFARGYDKRTDHWEEDICAEAGDGLIPEKDAMPLPHAVKRDF